MKTNNKFYEKRWFCILLLFLFAPVGIFLLWKYKYFSVTANTVLSIVFAIFFIVLLVTPNQDNTLNDDTITDITKTTDDITATPVTTPSKNTKTPAPTASIEYDALQRLYLELDPEMSYKKMIKLVKATKLPYSVEKSNGSRHIQVAFMDGATVHKHKKEDGDYLEIIYLYPENENSSNDILEKYTFGTCAYIPNDSTLELINHVSGYYFSYYEPGNYISDFGKTLNLDKEMSKKEQLDYYFENK